MEWETVASKKSAAHGKTTKSQAGNYNPSVVVDKIPVVSSVSSSARNAPARNGPARNGPARNSPSNSTARKRKTKKVPPVATSSFQQCLDELQIDKVKEAIHMHGDNHMNALKEVHGYLLSVFSKVECEKDYTFFLKPPGFPLCALPPECRDSLLKMVMRCPVLTQEKVFRYFVDLLLGGAGGGANTYATRIMLLLLIQSNNAVCVEAETMMKLCLESNISKVPEALSLLWVGLPHPKLHPFTSLRMWPGLCLFLLKQVNVPRQVFTYAVEYTSLLIRSCVKDNGAMLLETLSPSVLSSMFSSPQLLNKRTQKNVQEMLDLSQDAVLELASDALLGKYFRSIFKLLSSGDTTLVTFSTGCLLRSRSCWEAWSRLGPTSPSTTTALLKELSSGKVAPPPLPMSEVTAILNKLASANEKNKEMAKVIVSAFAAAEKKGKSGWGRRKTANGEESDQLGWCSCCGVVVMVMSVVYLCLLSAFLYYISIHGPDKILQEVGKYITVKDIRNTWQQIARVLSWYCELVLELTPQYLAAAQQFFHNLTASMK